MGIAGAHRHNKRANHSKITADVAEGAAKLRGEKSEGDHEAGFEGVGQKQVASEKEDEPEDIGDGGKNVWIVKVEKQKPKKKKKKQQVKKKKKETDRDEEGPVVGVVDSGDVN